jgi:chemotaxis protein methyltransferase CheR
MNASDFGYLADVLRRRSGLLLTANKTHLVSSRLAPIARRFGFRKTDDLLSELRYAPEEMLRAVTEAMTTNDSSFFRDRAVFDYFRGVILPSLLSARAKSRSLRIWCAGASTGQEPYSLAMMIDEAKLARDWRVEILATDLSSETMARASEGCYSAYEVQRGLSAPNLLRHFSPDEDGWRIKERIRRMVTFRTFNLLDSFGWLGDVDVIFCRNVFLYFDPSEKRRCLERLFATLADDGYLVLGVSETLAGTSNAFCEVEHVQGCYRKMRAARPVALAS